MRGRGSGTTSAYIANPVGEHVCVHSLVYNMPVLLMLTSVTEASDECQACLGMSESHGVGLAVWTCFGIGWEVFLSVVQLRRLWIAVGHPCLAQSSHAEVVTLCNEFDAAKRRVVVEALECHNLISCVRVCSSCSVFPSPRKNATLEVVFDCPVTKKLWVWCHFTSCSGVGVFLCTLIRSSKVRAGFV